MRNILFPWLFAIVILAPVECTIGPFHLTVGDTQPTNTPVLASPSNISAPTVAPTAPATETRPPTGTPPPPTSSIIYAAPVLFDPPDGRTFPARDTILRWRTDRDLKEDEVFEVFVWPEPNLNQPALGTTRDKIFPLNFRSWKYVGILGKFFWSVRIIRADGTDLSPRSQPFSFILLEPPPTNTKPPTPKPSPGHS